MVLAARYSTAAEAYMLQSRLELEGVPAVVTDTQVAQNLVPITVGGVLSPSGGVSHARTRDRFGNREGRFRVGWSQRGKTALKAGAGPAPLASSGPAHRLGSIRSGDLSRAVGGIPIPSRPRSHAATGTSIRRCSAPSGGNLIVVKECPAGSRYQECRSPSGSIGLAYGNFPRQAQGTPESTGRRDGDRVADHRHNFETAQQGLDFLRRPLAVAGLAA